MKHASRIYLDTNIFIYAFEETSRRSNLLKQIFATSDKETPFLVTSELSLAELLVHPYEAADDKSIDAYDGFIRNSHWLEVCQVTRQTHIYAAVMRSQYRTIRLPDALHLSTAIGAQCSHFLTSDKGLGPSYQLSHLRYGIVRHAPPLEVIRPDEATLELILESLK